jgi:pimeloyl-ACP methyl ester carboxylesterase
MGGMTMMALAVDHHDLIRERVVGAAFIATSPGGLADVSWGLGKVLGKVIHRVGPPAVDRLSSRQALVDSARRTGRDVEEFFVNPYSFASPVPLAVVRLTADMIFGTHMDVIAAFMPSLEGHDKREALAQFDGTEVLVLNGSGDLLTPPQHSEEIVRLVPGAEHVVVNDAGHIIMLEHPEVVNEQLLGLLARARRGHAERPDTTPAPGVRSTITDLAKRRRDREALRGVRRVSDVQRARARQAGHGSSGGRGSRGGGHGGRGSQGGWSGSGRG